METSVSVVQNSLYIKAVYVIHCVHFPFLSFSKWSTYHTYETQGQKHRFFSAKD